MINTGSVGLSDRLRKDLFDKTTRIPYSFFVRRKTGDVTSRITNDCKTVAYYSGQSLSGIIT